MNKAEISAARRPKLGQNFLTDRRIAEQVVDAAGNLADRAVIEIGPGRGILTNLLSRRARRLIAIEFDRVLAAQLRMHFSRLPNVEIIEADILKVELPTLLGPRPGALAGVAASQIDRARVVGNIPYYITSDILLWVFANAQFFDEIILMTQLEVADRIAAVAGSRDYGLLSATTQLFARVEKLFDVPAEAFAPPPKVESAVLRLKLVPRWSELQVEPESFQQFLKASFAQKRKTLLNNLKTAYDVKAVRAAMISAQLRPDIRAEAVPLEKAAAVFHELLAGGHELQAGGAA